MKELKKLSLALRALGLDAKVVSDSVYYGGKIFCENTFAIIKRGECVWKVWKEDGRPFEVHFYAGKSCVYDCILYSSLFEVVQRISFDCARNGE